MDIVVAPLLSETLGRWVTQLLFSGELSSKESTTAHHAVHEVRVYENINAAPVHFARGQGVMTVIGNDTYQPAT